MRDQEGILVSSSARRTVSNKTTSGSDWKGKLSRLFEQTSTRASEVAKEQTSRTLERLEDQGKQTWHVLSTHSHKAVKTLAGEAQTVYEKGATSAKDAVRKSSQRATERLQSTVSDASRIVSQTSQAAADAATERIRTSSLGVMTQAREMGMKAVRWLALWSLAAIFVYGVATSIPTALIKHFFSGKEDDTKKSEHSLEQQPPGNEVSKRWFS